MPPPTPAALGVVPVERDDDGAPEGSAALRELGSVPLVRHAVAALVRSAAVARVLVPAAPGLVRAVADALAGVGAGVEVVAATRAGPGGQLLAALEHAVAGHGAPDVVVVHDPLHPLAPARLVDAVVALLRARPVPDADAGCSVVVPVRPVTDTLTWVAGDGTVLGHADRELFRMVYRPQAFRGAALRDALANADPADLRAPGAEVLPGLVLARGGRLGSVPAPDEVFRVASAADLVLAEAMLHLGAEHQGGEQGGVSSA